MFTLPELPYAYNALEPFIDEETMRIHHTKHHQTYIDNLNKLNAENLNLEELLKSSDQKILNNAGGHYNHSFFWQIMSPKNDHEPVKEVVDLKDEFTQAALSRFGSGWAWIVAHEGKLKVVSTPNQDVPIGSPVLALDVWEHSYYLKYNNRRAEYIDAWWNIVNWQQVEHNLANANTGD